MKFKKGVYREYWVLRKYGRGEMEPWTWFTSMKAALRELASYRACEELEGLKSSSFCIAECNYTVLPQKGGEVSGGRKKRSDKR